MRTLLALAVLLFAACVAPAERGQLVEGGRADTLEPTYAPLASPGPSRPVEPDGSPTVTPSEPAPTEGEQGTGSTPADGPSPGPRTPRPSASNLAGSALLRDPAGDVTGVGAPDWADLRAARLVRSGTTFTLTHTLGDAAPQEGDGTNTMNIATFFDIDGDGAIDYEIWANLSPEGWGTSYFDEREGTARYAADDDVEVAVVRGAVELRFPTSHLGGAPSFRWSIASEYGPYQAIGSDAMARDYLPDDRSGRWFPD